MTAEPVEETIGPSIFSFKRGCIRMFVWWLVFLTAALLMLAMTMAAVGVQIFDAAKAFCLAWLFFVGIGGCVVVVASALEYSHHRRKLPMRLSFDDKLEVETRSGTQSYDPSEIIWTTRPGPYNPFYWFGPRGAIEIVAGGYSLGCGFNAELRRLWRRKLENSKCRCVIKLTRWSHAINLMLCYCVGSIFGWYFDLLTGKRMWVVYYGIVCFATGAVIWSELCRRHVFHDVKAGYSGILARCIPGYAIAFVAPAAFGGVLDWIIAACLFVIHPVLVMYCVHVISQRLESAKE